LFLSSILTTHQRREGVEYLHRLLHHPTE